MMDSVRKDLTVGLTAAADALEMDLEMQQVAPFEVYGESVRVLNLFGKEFRSMPTIIESFVCPQRSLVILVAHLIGNLYCCLLSDSQEAKMTLMLLDGPKLGLTPTAASNIMPKHWLREKLYLTLLPALRATYEKTYYAKAWTKEEDRLWMEKYLNNKAEARRAQHIKT